MNFPEDGFDEIEELGDSVDCIDAWDPGMPLCEDVLEDSENVELVQSVDQYSLVWCRGSVIIVVLR